MAIIQFCGGCGYYRFAASTAEKLQDVFPGDFYCELRGDVEQTGRLDVRLFFNTKPAADLDIKKGVLVHCKEEGDDIPYKDWKIFLDKVQKALDEHQ